MLLAYAIGIFLSKTAPRKGTRMKLARSRRRFLLALGAIGAAPLGMRLAGANDPHAMHDMAVMADVEVPEPEDVPVAPEEITPEDAIPDASEPLAQLEGVDRRLIQAYYSKPQTGGGVAYLRYTPIHVLAPGATLELMLRSKKFFATPPPATLTIYGAPKPGAALKEKGPLVASATIQPRLKSENRSAPGLLKSRVWVWDWKVPTGLPDGNYVLHSNLPGTLPASVIIAAGPPPPLGTPRKLAVCTTNMRGDRPVTGDTWFWVDYPVNRRSFPIGARGALPFTEPMKLDNMWVENITATTGTFIREPIETEQGWVLTNPQQRYSMNNAFRELGDLRAGKRFDGRPGNVVSGTAFDDGLYALTPIGACFISLTGEIKPLFGRFVRPGALYPDAGARRRNHELIGQWACPAGLNAAMAMCVTKDRRTAYVADSDNNRILEVDLTQNPCVVRHLAGRYLDPAAAMCAHSAYRADMRGGQVDGPADQADFGHPLGVLLSDDERTLYIGDDHNCAIRKIDLRTRTVSTAIQSSMVHPHTALPLGKANIQRYRQTMAADGAADRGGVFMHVGQMAWDSKGRIIAAIHHSFEIRRFDLARRTSERVALTAVGSRGDMQPRAWVSVDCDRTGELGVVDRIVTASWFADTEDHYLPNPDGTYSAKQDILSSSPPGHPRVGSGPARHVTARGYPWFVKIGPGSLWIADSSNGGVVRIRQKLPTDPAVPAIEPGSLWTSRTERHERGAELWYSEQPNGNPPRFLLHGASGANQIGFELTARMGAMSDAELATLLGRGQYSPPDWEALLAYVKMVTLNTRA